MRFQRARCLDEAFELPPHHFDACATVNTHWASNFCTKPEREKTAIATKGQATLLAGRMPLQFQGRMPAGGPKIFVIHSLLEQVLLLEVAAPLFPAGHGRIVCDSMPACSPARNSLEIGPPTPIENRFPTHLPTPRRKYAV